MGYDNFDPAVGARSEARQEAVDAAAARRMAKDAARDQDSSDGVVPRPPTVRERIAKLLGRS